MGEKNKKKIKIGIIGLGFVGDATRNWFLKNKNKYELFLYDKYKSIGSLGEVNKADIVFVAVPTPFRNNGKKTGYDDSAVKESIKNIKNGKIVVIKSTVLPGSTERLQKLFPKKTILFNPEFLRAKTAREDFLKPDRQIIGYADKKGRMAAPKILKMLPESPYPKIIKSGEVEMIKYFNNSYLGVRVVFANQIYDLCRKLGVDYDIIKECLVQDKRIGNSHFSIFSDGYRGYGGGCLPKDINSLIQFARKKRTKLDLLEKVEEVNKRLQKKAYDQWLG